MRTLIALALLSSIVSEAAYADQLDTAALANRQALAADIMGRAPSLQSALEERRERAIRGYALPCGREIGQMVCGPGQVSATIPIGIESAASDAVLIDVAAILLRVAQEWAAHVPQP